MGPFIHDHLEQVAVTGNLDAHNFERNPWYKGGASGIVVSNFVYNPAKWAIRLGYVPREWGGREALRAPRMAIVGNVLQHGADTLSGLGLVGTNSAQGKAYLSDNLAFDRAGSPVAEDFDGIVRLGAPPAGLAPASARPASETEEWVLRHAGACPADRDLEDRRRIDDIRAGRGRIIDSQQQVGGYPVVEPTRRASTVPAGDVEAWLESFRRAVEGR